MEHLEDKIRRIAREEVQKKELASGVNLLLSLMVAVCTWFLVFSHNKALMFLPELCLSLSTSFSRS